MKSKLILTLGIVCLFFAKTQGQFIVYQDEKGQVLTTVDNYATGKQYATTASHTRVTCLGSPFMTFPVWQEGAIQLDRGGKQLTCQLAYNLFSNEVLCRFNRDSAVTVVTPEFFTINDRQFVRLQNSLAGMEYRTYFSLLHNGPTKLWTSLSSQLEALTSADVEKIRYHKDLTIQAAYHIKPKYYIQKTVGEPTPIALTKKSLLDIFPDQAYAMAAKIPNKSLSTNDVIDAINYYDSLVATTKSNVSHLSNREAFKLLLDHQITYPAKAGFQGIYGRVYAGFDVDSLGKIRNIVILSPQNIGFGFAEAAKKSLKTLSDIPPAFRGQYALPVTFTYTNTKDNTGTHSPVNHLPEDRMGNRTLLEEIVVPFVVSKPVITSREVWGYYN